MTVWVHAHARPPSRAANRGQVDACPSPFVGPSHKAKGMAGASRTPSDSLLTAPVGAPAAAIFGIRHPRSGRAAGGSHLRPIRHPAGGRGPHPLGTRPFGVSTHPALKVSLVLTAGRSAGGRFVGHLPGRSDRRPLRGRDLSVPRRHPSRPGLRRAPQDERVAGAAPRSANWPSPVDAPSSSEDEAHHTAGFVDGDKGRDPARKSVARVGIGSRCRAQ